MISSAVFERYTGVSPDATLDEMMAALTETQAKTERAEIGNCLLCHRMQKRFTWSNEDTARNHPTIKYSSIRRNIDRGAILTQCHEDTLSEIYPSLQATSNERAATLKAECLRITDPQNVTEYVRWAVVADVVAAKMQSTPENHAALVELLKNKDISHPIQVRNALPDLAASSICIETVHRSKSHPLSIGWFRDSMETHASGRDGSKSISARMAIPTGRIGPVPHRSWCSMERHHPHLSMKTSPPRSSSVPVLRSGEYF